MSQNRVRSTLRIMVHCASLVLRLAGWVLPSWFLGSAQALSPSNSSSICWFRAYRRICFYSFLVSYIPLHHVRTCFCIYYIDRPYQSCLKRTPCLLVTLVVGAVDSPLPQPFLKLDITR
ncbi:hypothetical protein FPV67DRAFT_27448 [Lyophyllum atratum]|nr:hypothetical protein FPV67DRAFT_27448 [Lyophyllum atratum]